MSCQRAERRTGHLFAAAGHREVATSYGAQVAHQLPVLGQEELSDRFEAAQAACIKYVPALAGTRLTGHTLGTRAAAYDPGTGIYTSETVVKANYVGRTGYHAPRRPGRQAHLRVGA